MNSRLSHLLLFVMPAVLVVLAQQWTPKELMTGVELGRRIYVSEGCIHCHSQYLRPDTLDEAWWGKAKDPGLSRRAAPVLIGNRRQGPDLMLAGRRLSREWQRRHLVDPQSVVPTSRMPAYAHLFASDDVRGEALLDYLENLRGINPQ